MDLKNFVNKMNLVIQGSTKEQKEKIYVNGSPIDCIVYRLDSEGNPVIDFKSEERFLKGGSHDKTD